MPTTQVYAVLTTRVMPGSAVLDPGFPTKRVGISALLFTSQGISEQRAYMHHPLCLMPESSHPRILPSEQHRITCLSIKGVATWRRISFPILQPHELAPQRVHINCLEIEAPVLRQILPETSCGTQRLPRIWLYAEECREVIQLVLSCRGGSAAASGGAAGIVIVAGTAGRAFVCEVALGSQGKFGDGLR